MNRKINACQMNAGAQAFRQNNVERTGRTLENHFPCVPDTFSERQPLTNRLKLQSKIRRRESALNNWP